MKKTLLIVLVSIQPLLYAQVGIGIGTTTPDPSSILDLTATDKGMLVPRVTQSQRLGISNPAQGLLVYQTDNLKGFYYFDGSVWTRLKSGIENAWELTGNSNTDPTSNFIGTTDNIDFVARTNNLERLRITGAGRIGIGINTPNQRLHVRGNTLIDSAFAISPLAFNAANNISISQQTSQIRINNTAGPQNNNISYSPTPIEGQYLWISNLDDNPSTFASTSIPANTTMGFVYTNANWRPIRALSTNAWALTGNAGTNSSVNFIGTTDTAQLRFRVNNQSSGFIGTAVTANTFFGYQAGSNISSTGTENTFLGFRAGTATTTGQYNVAIGCRSMLANTTGFNNTAIGVDALSSNSSGGSIVAVGKDALKNNTTGSFSVAVGASALASNTIGHNNLALGYNSLNKNTSGSFNIGLGFRSLHENVSGGYNTALGVRSLENNTTGSRNIAIGTWALHVQNFDNGGADYNSNNIAIGYEALYNNNPLNTATGVGNVAVGNQSLRNNSTGANNTAVGYLAGYTTTPANAVTTGSNNTFIGYNTGFASSTQRNNATAIGYNAKVDADNALILGGTGSDAVNVGIGITAPSVRLDVRNNTSKSSTNPYQTLFQIGTNDLTPLSLELGLKTDATATNRYGVIRVNDGVIARHLVLQETGGRVGIGTSSPESTFHLNTSGDTVTMTTDWGFRMYHYDAAYGTNASRPYLFKGWNPTQGDFMYLSSTGNRSNERQGAIFLTVNSGILFGKGHNSGTQLSVEHMRIDSTGRVGIGTSTFVGGSRLQVGDGTSTNNININSSSGSAFGVGFYTGGTYRAGLGFAPVTGQDWFYIYTADGGSIFRSRNGNTVIGNGASASFSTTLENTGSLAVHTRTVVGPHTTLNNTDFIVIVDQPLGSTITLPTPSNGRLLYIRNISTFNVTVSGGGQNIIGFGGGPPTSNITLTAANPTTSTDDAWFVYDGTNWVVLD